MPHIRKPRDQEFEHGLLVVGTCYIKPAHLPDGTESKRGHRSWIIYSRDGTAVFEEKTARAFSASWLECRAIARQLLKIADWMDGAQR